jgi:hypothetical protein
MTFAPFLLAARRADPSLIQRDAIRATAGDTDQEMAGASHLLSALCHVTKSTAYQ